MAETTTKELTATEAAKRVKRPVTTTEVIGKDDLGADIVKKTTKQVSVAAAEVLAFKDCGDTVVDVTTDGQKFSSAD